MNRVLFIVTAFAALPFLLAAQTPAAKPLQTYRDDSLKLSLTFPATMTVAPKQDNAAIVTKETQNKGTVQRAIGECTTLPLNASQTDTGLLLLVQVNVSGDCAGITFDATGLPNMVKGTLSTSLARIGPGFIVGDPVPYDMSGHSAQLLFGTVPIPNQPSLTLYAAVTCTVVANNYACWEALANTKDDLHRLLQNQITFDGSTSVALVPVALMQ